MGKTVTTAFASFDPPVTRNPWNLDRTPGGSSSGSAAAVACGMCLGALATQTGGSITRPASYCGVYSLKPTYGRVSVDGVLPLAPEHGPRRRDGELRAGSGDSVPGDRRTGRSDDGLAVSRTTTVAEIDRQPSTGSSGIHATRCRSADCSRTRSSRTMTAAFDELRRQRSTADASGLERSPLPPAFADVLAMPPHRHGRRGRRVPRRPPAPPPGRLPAADPRADRRRARHAGAGLRAASTSTATTSRRDRRDVRRSAGVRSSRRRRPARPRPPRRPATRRSTRRGVTPGCRPSRSRSPGRRTDCRSRSN